MAQDYKDDDNSSIYSFEDCMQYFHEQISPPSKNMLGLEYELILIDKQTSLSVPYFGQRGLSTILSNMVKHGYHMVMDAGCIVGLNRENTYISLEPGGQLEFSSSPCQTAHEISQQLNRFLSELYPICESLEIIILTTGYRPFGQANLVESIPRSRYVTLMPHLEKLSTFSHEQKMTASIQVSLDYHSQSHAGKSLLIASKCQPYIVALYASSPISNGIITAMKSYRMFTWSKFVPDRSGIPEFIFLEDFVENTFSYYSEWAINQKLLFIIRNDQLISVEGITFYEYLKNGYCGYEPQLCDWKVHLGTLFPEARLKNVIEVRSADSNRPKFAIALAAFWKGIIYNETALEEALEILSFAGKNETDFLYHQAFSRGMNATTLNGNKFSDILSKLLDISQQGLINGLGFEKDIFELNTLSHAIKDEKSLADQMIINSINHQSMIECMTLHQIEAVY